jgi:uncharacterized protein (DUF4415 family)
MTEDQWKNARRGHFYRPRKRQIAARVDADVLDCLKDAGEGAISIGSTRSRGARC